MSPVSHSSRWASSPFDLALFRVVVCAVVLLFTDVAHMTELARLPTGLTVVKLSAAFPFAAIPIDPTVTAISGYAMKLGCGLGLVGLASRPALVLATVSALYFLGVAQHVGAVVHHHHMVWFLAVLAASPCSHVLSMDAARGAAAGAPRPPRRSLDYGIPVWTARVLIGLIFLFPGVWKLAESGIAWAASDNLRNQMYWKWFEHNAVPAWRIDRYPVLLRGLAALTLVFELTLLPLLFCLRARPFVAASAFAFHMATELFMYIRFTALWPCYVVLIDAHAALRGLAAEIFPDKIIVEASPRLVAALRSTDALGRIIYRSHASPTAPELNGSWAKLCLRHPLAPLVAWWALALRPRSDRWERAISSTHARHGPMLATAAALLLGSGVAGATGTTQAWPFACYPTFQWLAGDTIPHLAIDGVRGDGTIVPIATMPQSQKEWGVVWSVIGVTHGPFQPERLLAFWITADHERRAVNAQSVTSVRFFRAYSSVIPEQRGWPPVRRELLYELRR